MNPTSTGINLVRSCGYSNATFGPEDKVVDMFKERMRQGSDSPPCP